jgi:hypothetical protein
VANLKLTLADEYRDGQKFEEAKMYLGTPGDWGKEGKEG